MLSSVRIVTLSENTVAANGFHAEWGVSLLAQTDEGTVLLDTGNGVSAIQNADRLGIDLAKIDKLVLSHSHSDHTGGLREFLTRRKKDIDVIAHPDIFALKYMRLKGERDRFSGIPFRREELESRGARFCLSAEPVQITDNILTTGEVPKVTDFERVVETAFRREGTELVPDDIRDDQSVVLKTKLGLVVLLGCAHRGVVNHLLHAQKITGEKKIHTVVGGCHLFNAKKEQVDATIAALKELDVQQLGVSHCTGLKPAFAMMEAFGERFFFNNAGRVTAMPPEKAQ
jgi:7,8-dihydropterin-6-yl-methyl-4-(beta-D-ribofuranosyl)aminobenzene 5'-phosphate synthase